MSLDRAWIAYLAAAVGAELLLPVSPLAATVVHAAVLVGALSQFGWALRYPLAIGDPSVRVLPAIALLPLLRLLSLTLPVPDLPAIAWLALAGAPLVLAVPATAKLTVVDVRQMGLATVSRDGWSIAVAALGLPAGVLLAGMVPPELALPSDTPLVAGLSAFVLIACAVIPEELIFRGMLQPLLSDIVGRWGIVLASLAWAATYVGSGSLTAVAVTGALGLAFGWEARRSGSLWAPLIAHSLLAMTAQILGPMAINLRG